MRVICRRYFRISLATPLSIVRKTIQCGSICPPVERRVIGFSVSRTMELGFHPLIRRPSLESSSGCIPTVNTPATAWGSPSASELSSDTGDTSGSSQSRAKDLNSPSQYRSKDARVRALIVVVEDNPTDVFLISEAIAAYGLQAELKVVEDGEKAISLIARIEANESEPCPQLILLDLNLPGTDGFEVLKRLRES